MARTITARNVEAPAALLRGMPWVHQDNGDAYHLRFVRDVLAKLVESPVGKPCSLPTSGLNPSANACQFFQGNRGLGALRRLHNGFRYGVVDVFLVAGLFAGNLAKLALGGLRSFALQIPAAMREDAPLSLDVGARVLLAVGVRREIDDAQVDAEHVIDVDGIWILDVAHASNIEHAVYQHQIDFTLAVFEQLALPSAALKGNGQPAVNRPDRDRIIALKAKDTIIVWLRGVLAKCAARLFVKLVAIGHFGDTPNSDLSSQSKCLTTRLIGVLVQLKLSKALSLPSLFGQPITRSIRSLKRSFERRVLLLIWKEFYVSY